MPGMGFSISPTYRGKFLRVTGEANNELATGISLCCCIEFSLFLLAFSSRAKLFEQSGACRQRRSRSQWERRHLNEFLKGLRILREISLLIGLTLAMGSSPVGNPIPQLLTVLPVRALTRCDFGSKTTAMFSLLRILRSSRLQQVEILVREILLHKRNSPYLALEPSGNH